MQNTTTVMANFLNIENLTKSYGDRLLFGDITFGVDEGDKIGIVARNGTGKSTLLRILAGQESADSGNVVFRNGIRIGYLPQEPAFRPGATVIEAAIDSDDPMAAVVRRYSEAVASGDPRAGEEVVHEMDAAGAWNYEDRLRQLLTRFGLDDFSASVDKLSGGQRKRLAIARTIMAEPDFLILDEPTNHLDMKTKDILKQAIKDFNGTVIVVSHDREFLDGLVEKVYEFGGGQVKECLGGIYEFLEKKKLASLTELERNTIRPLTDSNNTKEPQTSAKGQTESNKTDTPAPAKKLSYAEQREREKLVRKARKKVDEAEAEIGRLEHELSEIESIIAGGNPPADIYDRHASTTKQLENAMSLWELASMEFDEISK